MQTPEVLQSRWIRDPDAATLDELRAWDWRAELERQERAAGRRGSGMTRLARVTDRSVSAVYRYALGTLTPPEAWLRQVARLLGKVVAA